MTTERRVTRKCAPTGRVVDPLHKRGVVCLKEALDCLGVHVVRAIHIDRLRSNRGLLRRIVRRDGPNGFGFPGRNKARNVRCRRPVVQPGGVQAGRGFNTRRRAPCSRSKSHQSLDNVHKQDRQGGRTTCTSRTGKAAGHSRCHGSGGR